MRCLAISALLGALSLCIPARAQQMCPWLTKGTAATLMDGDVKMAVHLAEGEGTCDFVVDAKGGQSKLPQEDGLHLRIAVSHLRPNECVTGERITGVGEDAVLCSMNSQGKLQEVLRGRVRGTFFTLTLTGGEATIADKATLRRILLPAAETVAGSLF